MAKVHEWWGHLGCWCLITQTLSSLHLRLVSGPWGRSNGLCMAGGRRPHVLEDLLGHWAKETQHRQQKLTADFRVSQTNQNAWKQMDEIELVVNWYGIFISWCWYLESMWPINYIMLIVMKANDIYTKITEIWTLNTIFTQINKDLNTEMVHYALTR